MHNVRVECIYVGSEKHFLCNNVYHGIKLTCLICIYALFVFIVYAAHTLHMCDWGYFSCYVKKATALLSICVYVHKKIVLM